MLCRHKIYRFIFCNTLDTAQQISIQISITCLELDTTLPRLFVADFIFWYLSEGLDQGIKVNYFMFDVSLSGSELFAFLCRSELLLLLSTEDSLSFYRLYTSIRKENED